MCKNQESNLSCTLVVSVDYVELFQSQYFFLQKLIQSYSEFVYVNLGYVAVFECTITARQYGEVVLPDAASGQGSGTLFRKLSRCKEGMAHFLPSWYKFY